ncbi:RNA polymerase factor sigma-32 [Pseudobdellovibrio sp. HCB154]|uniref:RNA polymerase factor sigma-32 n=1 Tax=Pseudobdellovibrio sp. HCB154 TaxID=3386277 RepID=UPI003917250A
MAKKKVSAKKATAKTAAKKASAKKVTTKKATSKKAVVKAAVKKAITKIKTPKEKEDVKKVHAVLVEDHHEHDEPIDVHAQHDPDGRHLDADHDEAEAAEELEIEQPTHQLPTVVSDHGTVRSRDPLTTYLNEIRKYPVLSREEEAKLAKRYFETKDPEAAQALVRANLRFVVKIAAEYARFSSRMIDLIQEGNVGLMHAVKEYNPNKGARLITYAVWWIRGYIQEYLMRQFSMVRIGTTANQRKLFYQLQRQKNELEKMSSPENIAQLSHKLGIPKEEVEEMAKRVSGRDVSLDKTADDDSGATLSLGSILRKEDGSLPLDEQLALAEQLKFLKDAIESIKDSLTEKEKIILDERVLNEEPLTLQEIGEKYHITREAVRQNEARLINKIKTALAELMK